MSKIEWTNKTWNPLVGCDKVSAGCKNCYAIRMAYRLMHNPKMKEKYAGTVYKTVGGDINWTGNVNMLQKDLMLPMKWKKPAMVFVNSMSDLFHKDVPFLFIDAVFRIMADINQHTYQVLTKRPQRMLEFFIWKHNQFNMPWHPSPNVWLGVSVEDQKTADERIPILLQVPATIRFLSCEPLLGPLNLHEHFIEACSQGVLQQAINGTSVNWVIVGGESGPGARPMHPDWARGVRDQCNAASIPFFFKQWGNYWPGEKGRLYRAQTIDFTDGIVMVNAGKNKAGRLLDGRHWDEMPNNKI